jgi:hypothetical protein
VKFLVLIEKARVRVLKVRHIPPSLDQLLLEKLGGVV